MAKPWNPQRINLLRRPGAIARWTGGERRQRGGSMIETLVAIGVLSIGMLGMASMYATSVMNTKSSIYRATAVNVFTRLVEEMRMNPTAFSAGNFDIASTYNATTRDPSSVTAPASCSYPLCTPAQVAARSMYWVRRELLQNLPAGALAISRPGGSTRQADVWIMWQEPKFISDDSDANETNVERCPAAVTSLADRPRCLYFRVNL